MKTDANSLKVKARQELTEGILSYWLSHMIDKKNGGFYGKIDFDGMLDAEASKGAVLNTRILWTFSKAYNILKDKKYLEAATRAYEYINKYFKDPEYNGVYWEIDYKGNPINTQKYCYTQGFWIYALSEYYSARKNSEALQIADSIFTILEDKALDKIKNGYIEAFARNWAITGNVRISDKDLNENKTYNTHLHILEAYAALYRVSKKEKHAKALENLIYLLIEKFYNKSNGHFNLFFDENWNKKGDLISYGHDIEGAWLLWDAALTVGKNELTENVKPVVMHISKVAAEESIDTDGGQYYEGDSTGVKDTDKHWWPQAETVVGFLNAWQISKDEKYFQLALNTWDFIEKYIVDKEKGEWYWKVDKNRIPSTSEVRAGFWKCPYHNSRACFEIIDRI